MRKQRNIVCPECQGGGQSSCDPGKCKRCKGRGSVRPWMKQSAVLALKRARKTLSFMRMYFRLQQHMAKANFISEPRNWRETYAEVSGVASEWCKKALVESQVKIPSRHVW